MFICWTIWSSFCSWTESNVIIQDDISCIGPEEGKTFCIEWDTIVDNGTMKVNAAEITGNAIGTNVSGLL